MKGRIFVLALFLSGSTLPAHAVMVRYTDENGKTHYVDTDYMRIPERYMDQVRPQIEAAEKQRQPKKKAEEETKSIPEPAPLPEISAPAPPGPSMVEVYVSRDCGDCQALFVKLLSSRVPAKRIDVDTDPRGQEFYAAQGGELPITRIGGIIVRGNEPGEIISIYQERNRPKEVPEKSRDGAVQQGDAGYER